MTPAHGGAFAGGEQGVDAVGMHAARRIARAVLQHPGAIDDGVDPGEERQPIRGLVATAMSSAIQRAAGMLRAARVTWRATPTTSCPASIRPGDNGAADQPGRPSDQHAHPRLSVFSHGSNAPGCAARNAADATLISLFAAAQVSPCPALGSCWPRAILRRGW